MNHSSYTDSEKEESLSLREELEETRRNLAETQLRLERYTDRWKIIEQDFMMAAKVHSTLLPKPIRSERIDLDVRYIPYEKIGGDYCQVRFYDEETCYITMCDVAGHGVQGALLATRVSSEVRHWILAGHPPAKIVDSLNDFIYEHFQETGKYLTFISTKIDLREGLLTWSGAGHPSPLLIRKEGLQVEQLKSQNMVVGVVENALSETPEHQVQFQRGDRLIMFTDGLTEFMTQNSKMLGLQRLIDFALEAMAVELFGMADHILDQIEQKHRAKPNDDLTLIVAELK